MRSQPTDQAPQIKCRTCFALINANEQRCPKCRAPQNWRRHITVINALAVAMVALVVGALVVLVPWGTRLNHPVANAKLRTTFISAGLDFTCQIIVANDGDRQFFVRHATVEVQDENDKTIRFWEDEKTWGEPFMIEPGKIGTRTIRLGKGPGTRKNAVTRIVVYHLDGSIQQVVDSSKSGMSNGFEAPRIGSDTTKLGQR